MKINPIAYSYWRTIKSGSRQFTAVPGSVRADVRVLAENEVKDKKISAEQYEQYIGETYSEE